MNMPGHNVDTRNRGGRSAVPSRPRSWAFSLLVTAALVGTGLILSAAINPILGRQVHWDWAAALAAVSFVFLTLAIRLRWV